MTRLWTVSGMCAVQSIFRHRVFFFGDFCEQFVRTPHPSSLCFRVDETADFYATEAMWVKNAHDVMLGSGWKEGAQVLGNWLDAKL